jgi:hypothetical protein
MKKKIRKYDPWHSRLFHLNKSGSRWVHIDKNGNRETILVSWDGLTSRPVAVKYWEQCSNFAYPVVRQGKKLIFVYPDSEVHLSMWIPYEVKYTNAKQS